MKENNEDRLRRLLVKHEGLRLKPYKDSVGKLTIGVGRNIDDNGISEEEAFYLLNNDIKLCWAQAINAFPWFSTLDDVRQDVIINMIFNLGLPRFLGFKKFITAVSHGDYGWAVHEMLDSKWSKQVGKRAIELAEMMRYGKYKDA